MSRENLRRIDELSIENCAESYETIFKEAIQRCGLQRLVSLSSRKKLPLKLAEATFLRSNGPSPVSDFLSLVDGKKEEVALRQPGIPL